MTKPKRFSVSVLRPAFRAFAGAVIICAACITFLGLGGLNNIAGELNLREITCDEFSDLVTQQLQGEGNSNARLRDAGLRLLNARTLPQVSLSAWSWRSQSWLHVLRRLVTTEDFVRCPVDVSLPATANGHKVLFAGNLKDNAGLMPHFLLRTVQLAAALDPTQLYVSLYESGSGDATPCWLDTLKRLLEAMEVPHRIVAKGEVTRRKGQDRIEFLASVRCVAKLCA